SANLPFPETRRPDVRHRRARRNSHQPGHCEVISTRIADFRDDEQDLEGSACFRSASLLSEDHLVYIISTARQISITSGELLGEGCDHGLRNKFESASGG